MGKLIRLMRGIYVDAADDIDAVVLTHAVRIAKYLYPNILSILSKFFASRSLDEPADFPNSQRERGEALPAGLIN